MPAPPSSIDSAYVFTCENVLLEQDQVISAIRIVDLFWVADPLPEIPVENTVVKAFFAGSIRFKPGVQDIECTVQFKLIRPNGEVSPVGPPQTVKVGPTIGGAPAALAHIVPAGVSPRVMGVHYVVLMVDEREVARWAFTLLLRSGDPSEK